MSEITIITTIEITDIHKDVSEDSKFNKEVWGKTTANMIKEKIDADDVVVTNVQEFVLGDEE